MPFVEALAIEVMKAGGHAYVHLDTDRMLQYSHYTMPAEYLGRPPNPLDESLILDSDLEIRVVSPFAFRGLHQGMPPERRARENASEKAWDALSERSKRRVLFVAPPDDNDTVGTGLSADEYRDSWYRAAMADPRRMAELGESVRRRLAGAKRVRITSPEGTDLGLTIGKPPVVDAGPTTAQQAKGRPARLKRSTLPAGIVAVVPVQASVNGVVKAARDQCDAMVIDEVIQIRKAAPVSVSAAADEECVRQSLKDTDRVGYITVGLNPEITPRETNGAYFVTERGLGQVTVTFGDNRDFGGSNQAGEWFVALPGATLEADGKAIVKEGKIVEEDKAQGSASR